MSSSTHTTVDAPSYDAASYDVLRERLTAQGAELARRAEELNARRVEVFGSTGLRLAGTERLHTDGAALARDVVAVGDALLFGCNGAVSQDVRVGDVFALHGRDGLEPLPYDAVPGLLDDPGFVREFKALYRYYRDSRLLRLRIVDGRLLAVFRTGDTAADIRVLRWRLHTDGSVEFLDARGERDHLLPPAQDVTWTAATREAHATVDGTPYVRVPGDVELLVGTTGGTLTVRGAERAAYTEPVAEPLQSLADADIAHARVGTLVLLKVRPYKEETDRYLVFHTPTRAVVRLDGIGQACRRLPDDQGVVFPGGYCLATGAHKTFDLDTAGLEFERAVASPNGEDVLYAFHARVAGRTLLLPYNRIRASVATPVTGHGYALFDDGTLHVLRGGGAGEPARVHPVQVWRSPYVSDTYAAAQPVGNGPLERIGNPDLVRGVSDCLTLAATAAELSEAATGEAYEELLARCVRTLDAYHWLGDAEVGGGVLEPLTGMRDTVEQVLGEFAAVRALKREAAEALAEAAARIATLVRRTRGEAPRTAPDWVERLTELRRAQGRLMTLKEMRYADAERIDELAADVDGDLAVFGGRAMEFLARDDAFASYDEEVERLTAEAEGIATAAEAGPPAARIDAQTDGLRTVTEVVTGLDIGDATVRTAILERISAVLGGVNRARATLDARRRELADGESRAEFAAETALLGQAVTGALAAADTPEACDDQLAGLLLRLENLEARFGTSDEALSLLAGKRDEVYEAFAARKQTLQDERARHAERLASSAARVLDTVTRRLASLADTDEINTYFASDPLVAKVRRTAEKLRELGDLVRAEELEGRIAAARQEAARALRDRTDLYADGGTAIRLGRHRFAVNTQPLDLTLVPHGEDGMAFAVTGTDYRAPVTDEGFAETRVLWVQSLPSENAEVYRGEYLAARLLAEHGADALRAAADLDTLVRTAAEAAYDEGYEHGVHDRDAALILRALLRLHDGAGLLRYSARARAAAQEFWAYGTQEAARSGWAVRARSLVRARAAFGTAPGLDALRAELAAAVGDGPAAEYLVEELAAGPEGFVTGRAARTLVEKFRGAVDAEAYEQDLAGIADTGARRLLIESWLTAYAASAGHEVTPGDLAEAVALELCPELPRYDREAELTERVEGLLGTHPRIDGRSLTIRLDELLARVDSFTRHTAPAFRAYQRRRAALVAAERERLNLDAYRPRAMASFVRGRLVDEVYLPLVGDNLHKQMGPGSHGLLLLVSPPGYGKTTLMEYVAERLGMLLVKVDGPALGHEVTSLDPAEAPHSAARRELEKIRFALEAGNNVLLHLDDIQHTSPELLQKFIPLCDATRTLDGHDLRGKRFAVCMTANPYTESGSRFRIPDMLANRADVWNLGDVLTGKEDAFALSFVENALTANPALAPLAGRDPADLDVLVRLAAGDPTAEADRLTHPYSAPELNEVLAVLRHVLSARRTVLAVNAAYIASAARSDESRTEPRFQLQGSYRDMNKIVARISPVMNRAELAAVVRDHYTAEAQTLTTGAEANLLKLAELQGTLTPERAARWAELKAAHTRARTLGGPEEDPLTRAVAALGLLADRIAAVESAITRATGSHVPLATPQGRHAAR